MEDIGVVHVRLPSSEHASTLVRADIKIDASTFFIYLQDASDHWPFKIENESDHVVDFAQMVWRPPVHLTIESLSPAGFCPLRDKPSGTSESQSIVHLSS